jgi:hypothetical protein
MVVTLGAMVWSGARDWPYIMREEIFHIFFFFYVSKIISDSQGRGMD